MTVLRIEKEEKPIKDWMITFKCPKGCEFDQYYRIEKPTDWPTTIPCINHLNQQAWISKSHTLRG